MNKAPKTYQHYRFTGQDPAVDAFRLARGTEAVSKIATESGVGAGTMYRWLNGKTRRPQLSTFAAVSAAMGYRGYDWRSRRLIK